MGFSFSFSNLRSSLSVSSRLVTLPLFFFQISAVLSPSLPGSLPSRFSFFKSLQCSLGPSLPLPLALFPSLFLFYPPPLTHALLLSLPLSLSPSPCPSFPRSAGCDAERVRVISERGARLPAKPSVTSLQAASIRCEIQGVNSTESIRCEIQGVNSTESIRCEIQGVNSTESIRCEIHGVNSTESIRCEIQGVNTARRLSGMKYRE